FLILRALRGVVARRVRSEKAGDAAFRNIAAELIRNTWSIFLFFAAFALFAPFLALPASVAGMLHMMLVIVGALQAAIWARTLLTSVLVGMVSRNADDYSTLANASALLRIFVNVLVWALAIIFILDNLGANVATLVAGLGVGGIGIGLAAQGIFSDLFASLSIVLDKPFVRGDFIVFGDYKGSVEKIGLKATHIRALSGEQIVVSNTNLLNEKIQNYKRMVERRILFRLGVTYGTPADKLEKIPQWIKEAIDAVPRTRFDRSHFASYGDSSLDFETVYYALTAEYNVFMDMQQAINLAIFRKFAAEGVEFAYPTRTLYVEQAEKPAE
ncbi:MAG TPA: mechanosensitive ion channel family protein, partial [Parvularculaceae bacterium]|nr:mechanosensitive ion channel family protein [Parvularculaceae bacterium]